MNFSECLGWTKDMVGVLPSLALLNTVGGVSHVRGGSGGPRAARNTVKVQWRRFANFTSYFHEFQQLYFSKASILMFILL